MYREVLHSHAMKEPSVSNHLAFFDVMTSEKIWMLDEKVRSEEEGQLHTPF